MTKISEQDKCGVCGRAYDWHTTLELLQCVALEVERLTQERDRFRAALATFGAENAAAALERADMTLAERAK